jgi:hypothetical protein
MCSRDPQHRGDQRASIVERIGKDGAIFHRQPQGAQGSSDRVGRQAVLRLLENLRSLIRAGIQFTLGLLEKAWFAKPKLNGYECDHHDRPKAQSDNLSQRHRQYSTDGAGSFLLLLSQIGRKSWLGADSAGPSAGSLSSRQVPRGRVPGPRGPSWGRVDEGIAPMLQKPLRDDARHDFVGGRTCFRRSKCGATASAAARSQVGGLEHAADDTPGTGTKEEPPAQEKAPREKLEHGASGGRRSGG